MISPDSEASGRINNCMLPFLVQYRDLLTETEPPDHRGNVNFAYSKFFRILLFIIWHLK